MATVSKRVLVVTRLGYRQDGRESRQSVNAKQPAIQVTSPFWQSDEHIYIARNCIEWADRVAFLSRIIAYGAECDRNLLTHHSQSAYVRELDNARRSLAFWQERAREVQP